MKFAWRRVGRRDARRESFIIILFEIREMRRVITRLAEFIHPLHSPPSTHHRGLARPGTPGV